MNKIIKTLFIVLLCTFISSQACVTSIYASASEEEDSEASRKRKRILSVSESQPKLDEGILAPTGVSTSSPLARTSSHHYAVATTDTAFKHMLSLAMGSEKNIVISFLNSFIPAFRGDPIVDVEEAPVALPALRRPGEKQTFMDLHVISSSNVHYIIEMQAQRHVMFDERALFYAASTYSRQLSEKELSTEDWYIKLKPVIALQILDYDTNRIRGLKAVVPDTLVTRVREHPLPEGEFIKHYMLTDETSGQKIDYLQMVQVELPRAEEKQMLFPPQEGFRLIDWWVSVLRHANNYTDEVIEHFYSQRKIMPENIYKALRRLDLTSWNPRETKEYQEDIARRDLYQTTLAVEREEGMAYGIAKTALKAIQASVMTKDQAITIFNLGEVEINIMDQIMAAESKK